MMKLVPTLILGLLAVTSPSVGSQDDTWLVHRNDSIRVYYSQGKLDLAEKTLAISEKILGEYSRLLGMQASGQTSIFLVDTDLKWKELTEGKIPAWSDGFARPGVGVTYIHVKAGESINPILRHELIHILLGKNIVPGTLPRWFEEGMASYCSAAYLNRFNSALSLANLSNSLLSLEDVEDVLEFNRGKAGLAYAQSFAGFRLIFDSISWSGVREMISMAAQNGDWDTAFYSRLEMTEYEFDTYLKEFVAENFKWDFLFETELVLWTLIPLLVIVSYLTIRIKRNRTYRRWEEEEKADSFGLNTDEQT